MARGPLLDHESNAAHLHTRSALGFSAADAGGRSGDGGACRDARNLKTGSVGTIAPASFRRADDGIVGIHDLGKGQVILGNWGDEWVNAPTKRNTTRSICAENRISGSAPQVP